jgi:uncharacterized protein
MTNTELFDSQGRSNQRNVLGEKLEPCSHNPKTGFFRDGCCHTDERDEGKHTVCVILTDEFLAFSKSSGNDLSTPRPEYGFPGLQAGEQWCLCALRWLDAHRADRAPKVVLKSTHEATLEVIDLALLMDEAGPTSVEELFH